MLAVEKAQTEQNTSGTGRALIFGTFATVRPSSEIGLAY